MKIKYIILTLLGVIVLAGCTDKFLDESVNENGPVDPTIIADSEQSVNAAVIGIMDMLRTYNVATTNAALYNGIWHVQFSAVMQGNDLFCDPSNWWLWEAAWTPGAFAWTGARPFYEWVNLYAMINNCNLLLDALNDAESLSDQFILDTQSEVRALRAYLYFTLARRFCEPVRMAGGDLSTLKGLPLYTTGTQLESEGVDRGTLAELYDQIVADLDFAIDNFSYDQAYAKYRIGKDIALGWRAYVNLELGNYQEAYNDANTVWQSGRYPFMTAAQYAEGFNDLANPEWMFGLPFNQAQQQSYYSKFAVVDMTANNLRYRTAGFFNVALAAKFTATDMRNLKAYSHKSSVSDYVSYKFYDKPDLTGAYIQMRSSELYMIMIETQYHLGNEAQAHNLLFDLQSERDTEAVKSTNTGEDLFAEILIEYRKELYGETAPRYYNSRRLGIDMSNEGDTPNTFDISADSPKWTLPIPKGEFDRNLSLDLVTDQNPAW